MSKPAEALEFALAPDVAALLAHPIYDRLRSIADVRVLMESHVFAVWDFMSLVKSLQRAVTCVDVPWTPPRSASTARFLNEIVLGEESDEVGPGRYMSHCELYLKAMDEVGADAGPFRAFLSGIARGRGPGAVLNELRVPDHVRDFVLGTLSTVAEGSPHKVAASFLYGRENVIPGMFRKILAGTRRYEDGRLASLKLYLDRHIEVDEGQHGPLGKALLAELCGKNKVRWREAEESAREAVAARLRFWDGVLAEIGARAHRRARRGRVLGV